MAWLVRVGYKDEKFDPLGRLAKNDALDLGISGVKSVRSMPTYIIEGEISEDEVRRICDELLADPIIQQYWVENGSGEAKLNFDWMVEVYFKPGVTDPVAESVKEGIQVLGIEGVKEVKTGTTYLLIGDISRRDVETVCNKCLANPIIQIYKIHRGKRIER